MSNHQIREDKTCLNCGAYVNQKYCSKCGQENKESHISFLHLLQEFISDLIHFDNSFWKTTKYLLFFPAKLSLEYISGKRKSFVDPIKLYIFISFITFFLPAILPRPKASESENKKNIKIELSLDDDEYPVLEQYGQIKSIHMLDSIKNLENPPHKLSFWEYQKSKWKLNIIENTSTDKNYQIIEFLIHTLPKVLIIYMPFFAFWMWLIHLNKRKYYFDSAIFTLHFFSFMLTLILIYNIASCLISDWLGYKSISDIIFLFAGLIYSIYYFFKANLLFYNEKKWLSFLKGIVLLTINNIFIVIFLALFFLFALIQSYK